MRAWARTNNRPNKLKESGRSLRLTLDCSVGLASCTLSDVLTSGQNR
jgi:hypothetical protein